MKITRLSDYGVPERFIERWTATLGPDLLDWQAEAVRHFDLFGSGSLVVIAPTSSGKTFLAELAATAALMRRRKVVYVAPLKTLVTQKYERFREVFSGPPLGFRVLISTRDRHSADARLRRADFDIAVTVYEKWHALLLSHLDLLSTVDLVILDEPQLLGDPKRGPVVAAICDAMAAVSRRPRVLMLTSRLPHASALAGYLGAQVQTVHRRPVELRLGVFHDGQFHFREHNSTEVGDEALPWDDTLPDSERPIALLDALASRGERILVFCPSKMECHRRAAALAERRSVNFELDENDRWRLETGPSLAFHLTQWLPRGVGVHHADLTPSQRALVESLFAGGRLAVVFCTGTLAWGVHLPATTVFVDAEKYATGPYAGRMVPVPLGRLEFEGMAGRAGRLGLGGNDHVARGILWSHTPCEADLLWQTYIAPESQTGRDESRPYDDPAGLSAFPSERRLLDWIVSGLVRSLSDAQAMAERSPFDQGRRGVLQYAPTPIPAKETDLWVVALDRLTVTGLVYQDSDNRLFPTPRGSVTATCGIGIDTAAVIVRALGSCGDFDPAVWCAFFSTLPETADAHLAPPLHERRRAAIGELWQTRFGEDFNATVTRRFADPAVILMRFPNAAVRSRAMLTALVLDDWASGRPTRDLEQQYNLPIGRLEPTADTLSWIFETAAALAATVDGAGRFARDFQRAGFQIRHGVRHDAADLIDALDGLLPRQTLLDLIARGWDDPATLAGRSPNDLAGLAPPSIAEKALQRCRTWIERQKPNRNDGTTTLTMNGSAALHGERLVLSGAEGSRAITINGDTKEEAMSPILQLDGTSCRARLAVQLAGRTVLLRLKSFKYLLALAAARSLTREGWIDKQEIEAGENQIKYLYQLRRELAGAGHVAQGLIENDGGGHYRLALPPQAIRFDLPRLLEHPDWDIRSRAEKLAACTTSPAVTAAA